MIQIIKCKWKKRIHNSLTYFMPFISFYTPWERSFQGGGGWKDGERPVAWKRLRKLMELEEYLGLYFKVL